MSEQHALAPIELHGLPVPIGRYYLHRQIARGGMATIHIARLMGDQGFNRIVAAKRLHPEFAEDAEFVAMFLDEARVASRVHHRNVVPVLDVVMAGEEVMLVQEYVHGVPLNWLLKTLQQADQYVPLDIAVSIACQILSGLHAAHETVDEMGVPLQIVHRDVSPQNILVAIDGSARLVDFGVAKATMAAHITRQGTYKGKLAYSAPEQLRGAATRQSDVYSLAVVLWELVVGHRMHRVGKSGAELVAAIMGGDLPTIAQALAERPSAAHFDLERRHQIAAIDAIVKTGLAVDTDVRWATAAEMETALTAAVQPAAPSVVAAWVKSVGKEFLERRERLIAAEESSWRKLSPTPSGSGVVPRSSALQWRLSTASGVELVGDESVSRSVVVDRKRRALNLVITALVAVLMIAVGFLISVRVPSWGASPSPPEPKVAPSVAPQPVPRAAPTRSAPARASERREERRAEPEPARSVAPRVDPPVHEVRSHAASEPSSTPSRASRSESRSDTRSESRTESRSRSTISRAAAPVSVSPPPSPPARSADECTPPYYFEGRKKIFKPACI